MAPATRTGDRPMFVLLAALALALVAAFAPGAVFADANDHLLAAARERPVARVKAALSAGADPNTRGLWNGQTPLDEALVWNENPAVIAAPLEAGADPNARRDDGVTPLHLATVNNNPEIIVTLLEAGADLRARTVANPLAQTVDGETPFHWAAIRPRFWHYTDP